MSYAELFAQKLNNESTGNNSTDSRRSDRKINEDKSNRSGIRTDRKYERGESRHEKRKATFDSRSEPETKRTQNGQRRHHDRPTRPYDCTPGSEPPYDDLKRQNSRVRQKNSSPYQGKIPDGWIGCPEHGELIHDFILPVKVPLHPNYDNHVKKLGKLWKMRDLFQLEQKFNKKIGLVIDLTNTRRYYCIESITQKKRIHLKQALDLYSNFPAQKDLDRVFDALDKFRRDSPNEMAIVHCTHGFNRTGLLIVSYLTERLAMPVSEALKLFSSKRNGGIYKDFIVEAIFEKYKKDDEECPAVTIPSWVNKKKLERKND